jgi:hypothetical protein
MFVASHTNSTTMKKSLLIIGIICLISTSSFAQTERKKSNYAIETDILWPFLVQTTRTHFTVKLWEKGNLRGDVYVGLGLHLEFSQTTGLGVLQNHVTTGKTYNSFDWLGTGYIGYKFELAKKKLYIIPQFGVAQVFYKSNPWPIYEDETLTKEVGETPFLLGSLRFGYNF